MEEFRHTDYPDKMDTFIVIVFGIMMCGGSNDMKARCLYDILQDDM